MRATRLRHHDTPSTVSGCRSKQPPIVRRMPIPRASSTSSIIAKANTYHKATVHGWPLAKKSPKNFTATCSALNGPGPMVVMVLVAVRVFGGVTVSVLVTVMSSVDVVDTVRVTDGDRESDLLLSLVGDEELDTVAVATCDSDWMERVGVFRLGVTVCDCCHVAMDRVSVAVKVRRV